MLAHQVVAPSELAGSWTFEPAIVAGLGLGALVYGRGRARLRRRIVGADATPRALAFYGGLVVLAAALLSPLEALGSTLFSAHMVQHLVLMLVAAPLLVYARPMAALVAGLPMAGREVARGSTGDVLRASARALVNPLVVWTVGTLALWAWHMPALYEAALSHDALHAVEHASFLGAALLFWSVVLGSGARRGAARPVAMLLVFASSVQSSALGLVLLLAPNALYPVHAAGARLWEVSPLGDQHVAGGLMWGPPALLYVVVLGWLLVRWFAEMEDAPPDPVLVGERA
jgi:putative membrane protein